MKLATAVTVLLAGTPIWGKSLPVSDSAPEVTVCMEQSANATAIFQAQGEVSKIFQQVPVRIAWRVGRACKQPDVIHIQLRQRTPESLQPGALAYALPYEGTSIELFYDRIKSAVPSSVLPYLLAHVLVHEITHILQGVARHSEMGVMKARWTPADYRLMAVHPLAFTPEDIQLIQISLKTRRQRVEALAGAPRSGQPR